MEPALTIRDYDGDDERSWLRCRALGFLETGYFDDVLQAKPTYDTSSIELVAATSTGTVTGLIDVTIDGGSATIETVAVHPDGSRRGVGTALLAAAIERERELRAAFGRVYVCRRYGRSVGPERP